MSRNLSVKTALLIQKLIIINQLWNQGVLGVYRTIIRIDTMNLKALMQNKMLKRIRYHYQ